MANKILMIEDDAAIAQAVKLNLEGLEHIAAFMQRMAERPEVQDALSAEGLK